MTWVFPEKDLEITINNAQNARKFDEPSSAKPGQMKAVDFIIQYTDRSVFIEFKDPQHPDSNLTSRNDLTAYYQSQKIDKDLVYKFRDSFIFEWASGRACGDIYYLVLIAIDSLTSADLDKKTKDLERKLPVGIPNKWKRSLAKGCAVFNLESWNQHFPDLSVRRISSSLQRSDPG